MSFTPLTGLHLLKTQHQLGPESCVTDGFALAVITLKIDAQLRPIAKLH